MTPRNSPNFSQDPNFASSNAGRTELRAELEHRRSSQARKTAGSPNTALLYVGSAPATPVYGTLNITSSPSGAEAFVDGQFVGYTPGRYGTQAGSHEVRVQLSGYNTFTNDVSLGGGQSLRVDASLSAVRRTGSVKFQQPAAGRASLRQRLAHRHHADRRHHARRG